MINDNLNQLLTNLNLKTMKNNTLTPANVINTLNNSNNNTIDNFEKRFNELVSNPAFNKSQLIVNGMAKNLFCAKALLRLV